MTYAHLEGRPVIITDLGKATGYWLVKGKWFRMHPADVTQACTPASRAAYAEFVKRFSNLPPLPKDRRTIPPLPTDFRFDERLARGQR